MSTGGRKRGGGDKRIVWTTSWANKHRAPVPPITDSDSVGRSGAGIVPRINLKTILNTRFVGFGRERFVMNMGKRVPWIIERKQAFSMRGRGGNFFPSFSSIGSWPWHAYIYTHTHPSRAARKVEEVEKVGGAYFKKKDRRGGGMLLSQCNPRSSLRFSAFPSLARHAIKPFFPWQTDAFCLLLSGQTARSEIIAARG